MVSKTKAQAFFKLRRENPDFTATEVKELLDSFEQVDFDYISEDKPYSPSPSEHIFFRFLTKGRFIRASVADKIIDGLDESGINFLSRLTRIKGKVAAHFPPEGLRVLADYSRSYSPVVSTLRTLYELKGQIPQNESAFPIGYYYPRMFFKKNSIGKEFANTF